MMLFIEAGAVVAAWPVAAWGQSLDTPASELGVDHEPSADIEGRPADPEMAASSTIPNMTTQLTEVAPKFSAARASEHPVQSTEAVVASVSPSEPSASEPSAVELSEANPSTLNTPTVLPPQMAESTPTFSTSSAVTRDQVATTVIAAPYSTHANDLGKPYPSARQVDSESGAEADGTAANLTAILMTPADSTLPPDPAADPPESAAPAGYLVAPHVLESSSVAPLVTAFSLNGITVNHLSTWQINSGVSFGEGRNTNLNFVGTIPLNNTLQQSVSANNVLTLNYAAQFLQNFNVLDRRELTLERRDPYTLLGQQLQLSLTGDCVIPGSPADAQCTYTPGLSTDAEAIDSQTLLPTQITQTSNFGDVVTPASLAAMQQPGFQRGADGQVLGVDLFLPNSGAVAGNTLTTATNVNRDEQFTTFPVVSLSSVNQTIQANTQQATLARTIQAPTFLLDGDQPVENILVAIATLLLPQISPHVSGLETPLNPNLNQSLFLAANNTRIPANSLTLYQAGLGSALTPETAPETATDLPAANFNAVWVGLSPITERSYLTESSYYELLGERRTLFEDGAEGGATADVDFLSVVNNLPFGTDNLNNTYSQIYLKFFEQDATQVSTLRQVDQLRYRPHLSFSGNITGPYDIFRYYTGIMATQEVMAYAGLDYERDTSDGWTFNLGAIGYINPSYDDYSRLSGNVIKRIKLGENNNLVLGTQLNWALDQDTQRGDLEERAQGSDLTTQAQLNLGPVSLGFSHLFSDVLPNSRESRTALNLAWRVNNNFSLAGYWALIDQNTSSAKAGASLNWRLGNDALSPVISISWNNAQYNYGQDLFGQAISTTANTFNITFKMGL